MTERPLTDYRFTFLHGVRVRSGTNYMGKVMGCNPHLQLVPPGKTTDEFPVMRDLKSWENAFEDFRQKYPGNRKLFEFRRFLPHLGDAWIRYLIELFSLEPGDVFLKDPSVRHLNRFFDMFPRAKLIILVRDGRDNVASSVKASLAKRKSTTLVEKSKSRMNNLLMRDFRTAARDWATSVTQIVRFDEEFKASPMASRYRIVRYEDIYRNPREMGRQLFEFMEVPWDEAILKAVENAEVVGSSFYGKGGQEDAQKPNWKATPKSEAFQPIGRWKGWNGFRKNLFKRIAGRQLIQMGYETSPNWQ